MRILIDKETGEEFEAFSLLGSSQPQTSDGGFFVLPAKQKPRSIDLSNLDPRVPVRVTAKGETLMDLFTKSGGAVLGFDSPILTLKTDRWVFNDNGTNPWPEGCVVECAMEGYSQSLTSKAHVLEWKKGHGIIASRYVGPAEGWDE